MKARRDQASAVANRDINPSEQLIAAYPDVACLIRNEAISQAFAAYEKSALRWKRIYVQFGRLSLIAVMLAMVSYDYQITLKNVYGAPPFLAGLAAVFAATGLFSQALVVVDARVVGEADHRMREVAVLIRVKRVAHA